MEKDDPLALNVEPIDVPAWRNNIRRELLSLRAAMLPEEHRQKSIIILNALSSMREKFRGTIGFYWPFRGEVDMLPFMHVLLDDGHPAALPVVVGKGKPLQFRSWTPQSKMTNGVYGIAYPADGEIVEPDTLLIPVVGFDSECYRLGYGGGFYDRTLAATAKNVIKIGVGFESARVHSIYPQVFDVPLNFVVTEAGCGLGVAH
jgi:5-formyltetrahydrofolate cyclo-ligase